jgi:hypothetical protein
MTNQINDIEIDLYLHLHRCVIKDRDQKYFGEVSFWLPEYRNRPTKVSLIFNFGNTLFGSNFLFYAVKPGLEPDYNLQINL